MIFFLLFFMLLKFNLIKLKVEDLEILIVYYKIYVASYVYILTNNWIVHLFLKDLN